MIDRRTPTLYGIDRRNQHMRHALTRSRLDLNYWLARLHVMLFGY